MKKKIIIIFSVLILIFILVYFFVFRIGKNTNLESNIQNVNEPVKSASNNGISNIVSDASSASSSVVSDSISTQASSSQVSDITNENVAPVDVEAVNKKFIEYAPKTTDEQLVSFSKIAAKGDMEECVGSTDTTDQCKHYFSIYQNNFGLCGDIENDSVKLSCYKELVFNGLEDRIVACDKEIDFGQRASCFNSIFWGAKTVEACDIFSAGAIRQICVDSVSFQTAIANNKANCSGIKDSGLKTACDQHFTPGDFDKDGLSDAEELKIGTNPYSADTDGDGYSDKEEVDKGYNPCGEGSMPTPAKLLEMCAKYTK
jgi:hypothetical protein